MAGRPGGTHRALLGPISNPGGWLSAAGSLSISLLSRYFAAHVTHHLPARAAPLRRPPPRRRPGDRSACRRRSCPLPIIARRLAAIGRRAAAWQTTGPADWMEAGGAGRGWWASSQDPHHHLQLTEICADADRKLLFERGRGREREKFASIFDQEIGR